MRHTRTKWKRTPLRPQEDVVALKLYHFFFFRCIEQHSEPAAIYFHNIK